MNTKMMKTMDGNEAAAYVSYAFTEVATIYPIDVYKRQPQGLPAPTVVHLPTERKCQHPVPDRFSFCQPTLAAVSYTHLDVYKRQPKILNKLLYQMFRIISSMILYINLTSACVSQHIRQLDVYKRQEPYSRH